MENRATANRAAWRGFYRTTSTTKRGSYESRVALMSTVRPKLHDRGNPRLDGVLDFVKFTARPMPLATLLDEAPRRLVQLLHADVCSLYLLEGEHTLVMRGNVGFDARALGQ